MIINLYFDTQVATPRVLEIFLANIMPCSQEGLSLVISKGSSKTASERGIARPASADAQPRIEEL